MNALRKYIRENVFCRCGRAVSGLVDGGLVTRPDVQMSETEVREWWLVSAELAEKLRARGLPVLRFFELHMWGREETGIALEDDRDLLGAIGRLPREAVKP